MENKRLHKSIVAGMIIIILGTILLLRNVGLLDNTLTHYIISWKTLLIVLGLWFFFGRGYYSTGVFVGGLGVIFWLPEIFHHQFALHAVLMPSVLLLVGITLLMKAFGWKKRKDLEDGFVPFEEVKNEELSKEI